MSSVILKKIQLLIIITVLATVNVYAISLPEKNDISGIIKDSLSGENLPFASVQVLNLIDSNLVTGTITDSEGNYIINNLETGTYIIIASYMGYNDKGKVLEIKTNKTKCDFSLLQESISLSGILIQSEKNLIEKTLEKTTINVSQNTTVTGGTAIDVMQTLPSVDIDIDGNINYRGSDKVIILINGEKSELVKSLDQIPADQIEKIELINNPSAKYEAEGMSGIINIVLKSGNHKTTLILTLGYPETLGANIGYSKMKGKTSFFINGGIKHNTKYQTKEHFRENYQNPNVNNYYQYDRQDQNLNSAFINTSFNYQINKKHKIGFSIIGSKKFDNADRTINYQTLAKSGDTLYESIKDITIFIDNYSLDGGLNYKYNINKNSHLSAKYHYSFFNQMHEMNNTYYTELLYEEPSLQNTYSKQINQQNSFNLDYDYSFTDSLKLECGYSYKSKNLYNNFTSEKQNVSGEWENDTALANVFNYIQMIHAVYTNFRASFPFLELQIGLRAEYTINDQNSLNSEQYFDFFPSINISHDINKNISYFTAFNRRINRPSIKMLNPFSDEYSDLLNMMQGNPDLKAEYVNSAEIGNRFVYDKLSGSISVYYRDIDQAISRIKSASNDSSLYVTFINLDNAKLIGNEISLSYKPNKWWNINAMSNLFYTKLSGEYANNQVDNSKIGWNCSLSNNFKLPENINLQISAYYRSKLPSVMGIYQERYYLDFAVSKKILKNKAQIVFKISDVFNTYKFGLDLDAIDENDFAYSQLNRRKNESRYFLFSFIYNISGKNQQQKNQKENFFLDGFDK